ncbi:PhzF family phenazine biosynthesis protein [Evansella sp. AB-P1]|uniref:PhzF family phenazine biosynthesis protein n=1 Tax=Evansella sp. AB-P1 TaxID=3037653 RepID=UPI00241CE348|nr:PhzF family phenazine biosynthesis protein [Evansella sp. AB-P1]MDG5789796.1 PhzF family phenazine biosynthesis protein [Evansella sp. AB-P1]
MSWGTGTFSGTFSRPWSGTDEDPVTGGTHTFLVKYWSSKLGKTKMKSFQASKRTGFMGVELIDNKLLIRGDGVIVVEGCLKIKKNLDELAFHVYF